MKWYVAFFEGDLENEYERFDSDAAAVDGFVYGDEPVAMEVYECNDDECLSPARRVYPPALVDGVKCPRCGGPLHKSYIPEYVSQCFECDEDFYGFEAASLHPDHHEKKGEKEMDEKEFGTEEWAKELVEGLGEMQHNGTGEGFPCPRCGHDRMDDVIVRNALSRYADVYICPQCGTDEALRDMAGKGPLPFLEWGMPMGFVNNSDAEDGDDDE